MFLGLREHEMRSNPYIIGVKIPFDPNILLLMLPYREIFNAFLCIFLLDKY